MQHVTLEQARAAQCAALETFGHLAAVGITRVGEDYGINVNLREPLTGGVEIPARIGGVPVNVQVVCSIRPL